MATAPQQPQLPLFYNDLMPLNKRDHAGWKSKLLPNADFLKGQHAIPVTVDEFADCQRHFPIVFSSGDNPVPLALMGLNENVNVFVDDQGQISEPVYMPAYVRRYPYMLAKLQPDTDELSLCFDPSVNVIGQQEEGTPLFDANGDPSDYTKGVLEFCQKFEEAGQRTGAFVEELKKAELLIDGEIAITQNDNPDKPYIYRGFQMVDENKLRDLPGAKLEEISKNGILPLLYAHLFSMGLMRVIFAKQAQQGKVPEQQPAPAA